LAAVVLMIWCRQPDRRSAHRPEGKRHAVDLLMTFDDDTGRPQARRLWPYLRIKKRTRRMMSTQVGTAIAVNSKVSIIGASHLSV
jgi:hypothetical protein